MRSKARRIDPIRGAPVPGGPEIYISEDIELPPRPIRGSSYAYRTHVPEHARAAEEQIPRGRGK
jgi:hypothetical protein